MSITDKLAQAVALIESHNKGIQEGEEGKVDIETFKKKLRAMGGTTEEALREATWEDLENCGLPRLLAKKVSGVFRAEAQPENAEPKKEFVSTQKAQRMGLPELVAAYDPNDKLDSAVKVRLQAICGDRKVVVFNTDGSVNVQATVNLINEKLENLAERETYEVNGKPTKTYKIGERRSEMADENPVFAGEALRPDGTSQRTDRSWATVPSILRQLVHLAINQTHDMAASDETEHWLLDYMDSLNDFAKAEQLLRKRFRAASVMLDELIEHGRPPMLKITIGGVVRKPNNPFYGANGHRKF